MEEERRLAAIMFTDISGYTSLITTDETKTLSLLSGSMAIQKNRIQNFKGTFIKEIGDGTLSWFQSAVNAVHCAMDIQRVIKRKVGVKLRIGIHLGEVIMKENDILGMAVNIASRLESEAAAGDIYLSAQVFDVINNIPDIKPKYVGKRELKNVPVPIDIYKIEIKVPSLQEKETGEDISGSRTEKIRSRSILVLPFKDLGPDRISQYIIDGISEEIIQVLSGARDFRIYSKNILGQQNETIRAMEKICRDFQISYILEGSLKKSKNEIRANVKLMDMFKHQQLWASKFKGETTNILDFQENMAQSVGEYVLDAIIPGSSG